MNTTQWLCSAVLAATVSACASQQAQTPSAQQPATGAAHDQVVKQAQTGNQASIDVAGLDLFADRAAFNSKNAMTLVDAVKNSGKKVGIFQFVGIDCVSCREEMKQIDEMIKASPKGGDIVHIVVMTDHFKDVTDAEYKTFFAKYAPGATAVYDDSLVWRHFASNPRLPDRATIIAMNTDKLATVSVTPGQQLTIVAAAEALDK